MHVQCNCTKDKKYHGAAGQHQSGSNSAHKGSPGNNLSTLFCLGVIPGCRPTSWAICMLVSPFPRCRWELKGQRGVVLWLTGLSGSGKVQYDRRKPKHPTLLPTRAHTRALLAVFNVTAAAVGSIKASPHIAVGVIIFSRTKKQFCVFVLFIFSTRQSPRWDWFIVFFTTHVSMQL